MWLLCACLLLTPFVVLSHQNLKALIDRLPYPSGPVLTTSPRSVKLLSLGYDQLFADLIWLQLIQYAGDRDALKQGGYGRVEEFINNLVALDPHFIKAYWFAAFLIGGEAGKPAAATQILEKGIASNPNDWDLPFIAGVNQYLYAHNEVAAARYYRMAAKFPQAPKWLSRQADILETHIPAFIKQINVWTNIYDSAEDPNTKERAKNKLCELWLRVYLNSPSAKIKERAADQLRQMGWYL